ncbi:hypothetical protein BLA15945_03333 [Burkholderia lata]|uniref:DUF4238 domain-containing protein n=1 Tax=Burkholderia lata (strain ATCC 17760 / DSM 23089 / LMG 22485 / NCIMB 9086 / R18194 / 383) TaxID=482957 RepID=A0A6P2LSH4_BURL3|nr:hypothetical protein BLA15945_03333 [Burkholderia lata]
MYVYDSEFRKLSGEPKAAGAICYRRHLYTLDVAQSQVVLLEEMFSFFETQWATVFQMLTTDVADAALSELPEMEKILRLFIACQFWRHPARRALVIEYADRLPDLFEQMIDDDLVEILDKQMIEEICEARDMEDAARIIQYFLLPLLTYQTPFVPGERFRIAEVPQEYGHDLICSDGPLIGDTIEQVFHRAGTKIFPFSRDRMLLLGQEGCSVTPQEIEASQAELFASAPKYVFASSIAVLSRHLDNQEDRLAGC